MAQKETPLPLLRDDLQIGRSAKLVTGAPSWVLYDPISHRYFEVNRRVIDLLNLWPNGTEERLKVSALAQSLATVNDDELSSLKAFLIKNRLVQMPGRGAAQQLAQFEASTRQGIGQWLSHSYLFFRIPLVRPQKFLNRTWPVVRPLFSLQTIAVIAVLGIIGIYLGSRQWDAFIAQARDLISLQGAALYFVALAMLKVLHELGHAYLAVSRSVRVPVMGVAFLMLFPILYTDVTDAWRLKRRRDKLLIDAGGVLTELSVALLATFFWAFLPDGLARTIAFAFATTSWIMSLVVNLNPFMRFDGYYFLSDLVGVQNLQPRSFALARWRLRELLFNLGDSSPELISPRLSGFMICYAWLTWIYRFFLFLGIALLIYNAVFKLLGATLFVIEILILILRPIYRELMIWKSMSYRIMRTRRSWTTFAVVTGLLVLCTIPLPTRIHVPATIEPAVVTEIYAPRSARIVTIATRNGAQVAVGDDLFSLATEEIDAEIRQSQLRLALLDRQLSRITSNSDDRASSTVTQQTRTAERKKLELLESTRSEANVRAPIHGIVRDFDQGLTTGVWVSRTRPILRIVQTGDMRISGYIHENDIDRLPSGGQARFISDQNHVYDVDISGFDVEDIHRARLLKEMLSDAHGGDLETVEDNAGHQLLTEGRYPINGTFSDLPSVKLPERGIIILEGMPESIIKKTMRQISAVLVRELSF
ncbi:HlyD family efflux transporter periplasmic adaptor subunit [Sagittula sp. SSi028]|uniref:HlyD family efflux transporter periplasmic adaptor subunit n=1 Tax=Sagittula sp. SSi028 TaxID=3400636 RepID=UPI003AF9B3AC